MNIKLFFKILSVLLDSIVFRTFKTCPDVELESISTNFSAYIIQDCKMSNGPQKEEDGPFSRILPSPAPVPPPETSS